MQLVEQGKLKLDESVYDILPELKDIKCLDEQGKLVPKEGDIVRLTHLLASSAADEEDPETSPHPHSWLRIQLLQ